MRAGDCRFHGRHRRTDLKLVERCRDCGHERDRGGVSRLGVAVMPWALWANALLLLALLLG